MTSQAWNYDPRRLGFTLARYKFVAKVMSGRARVLEVGCADAFGARVVQQEVDELTAVDFDPVFVEDARRRMNPKWPFDCFVHDMREAPVRPPGGFDGVYALDVLEHILPQDEPAFLRNVAASMRLHGAAVIGMPSLESQAYASPISKAGHVNCKSLPDLKACLERYFHNVVVFPMNDEIVHTGYYKLAHYLMAMCFGVR